MESGAFRLLEAFERSRSGPYCKKKDFDLKLLPQRLNELVKEYDIKFDPDQPVPNDDDLADSLFQAGLQLFLDLGVLCLDTERQIKFNDEEVKSSLRSVPEEITLGTGRDIRNIYHRHVEDRRLPVIFGGPFGGPVSPGRVYVNTMTSMAKEQSLSMVCYGSLREVEGQKVTIGTPIEVHATRSEARWMREAAARAGRPGMHLTGTMAESSAAEIAASDPIMGYRPSDGRNTCLFPSLQINYNQMNKVMHFLTYGTFIYAYMNDMIGGYSGGPATTAITAVASNLANLLLNLASYQEITVMHIHRENTSSRECIWAQNLVAQALSRNTKIITFLACMTSAGPCTQMILYEIAAIGLGVTCGSNLLGVLAAGSKHLDRYTGLEQRFMGEVGYAANKMKRDDANDLTKQILEKYENNYKNPPLGKTFQECYDQNQVVPSKEWTDIYSLVKSELVDLGLNVNEIV